MVLPVGGLPLEVLPDAVVQTSRTYKIDFERGRVAGLTDGLEAIKQLVFKILQTQRFIYPIYSSNYGTEPLVTVLETELERLLREALLQDERILDIEGFQVMAAVDRALVQFTVVSAFGRFQVEQGVNTDV